MGVEAGLDPLPEAAVTAASVDVVADGAADQLGDGGPIDLGQRLERVGLILGQTYGHGLLGHREDATTAGDTAPPYCLVRLTPRSLTPCHRVNNTTPGARASPSLTSGYEEERWWNGVPWLIVARVLS